jgi:hypothetical protein
MKDYCRMSEKELAELAKQFDIETIEYDDAYQPYFRRDYIIAFLVQRDAARSTRWAGVRSWLALIISIIALASRWF